MTELHGLCLSFVGACDDRYNQTILARLSRKGEGHRRRLSRGGETGEGCSLFTSVSCVCVQRHTGATGHL